MNKMTTRIIETLDGDLKTINVWKVSEYISLDMAIKKQGDAEFRSLFFVSSRPKKIIKLNKE